MSDPKRGKRGVSRRDFLRTGVAGVAGGMLYRGGTASQAPVPQAVPGVRNGSSPLSHIYHCRNGTPAQNVAKVFEMGYGGIENFLGPDDIVLLRPNLQWRQTGYVNSEIGLSLIDLILNRPGGFAGEIIVIEDNHRDDPHTHPDSGWCTPHKESNGPYNWFELIQYFVDHADDYPQGIHVDPVTGQINVTFQFLMERNDFTLEDPHPILTTYGGKRYVGAYDDFYEDIDPFPLLKYNYPLATCFYVRRFDIRYTEDIARVAPLNKQPEMNYTVFKSPHSGLYISLFKNHPTAWDPNTETTTSQQVKLINMTTLNHHSPYAGVTSVVKGHFGMFFRTPHNTGWVTNDPPTFYYAGGPVGYWLNTIRQPDLHISCAERMGLEHREEVDAYHAKSVAISTDPVALDYYVGKNILFPAGGQYGLGGAEAGEPWSNDPTLEGGYYRLLLEFCHDPLADHSVINGTLNEEEMGIQLYDFAHPSGDFNQDGAVDLHDYEYFHGCADGPGHPPPSPDCEDADLDADTDVDLADFDTFLDSFGESR